MKHWEALTGQVYQKHWVSPEMQHETTCILTMSHMSHSTPQKHKSLSGSIISQAHCVTDEYCLLGLPKGENSETEYNLYKETTTVFEKLVSSPLSISGAWCYLFEWFILGWGFLVWGFLRVFLCLFVGGLFFFLLPALFFSTPLTVEKPQGCSVS